MKEKLVTVKNYHLAGDGIKIVFSQEDPAELELVYEDQQGERRFSGRAIYREEIKLLGFMRSVVLEEEPDSHRISLSLAVPSANRSENAKSIPVKTSLNSKVALLGKSVGGTIVVKGKLTDEGVECQTLRTDAGELYTLVGDLKGFQVGDRVCVAGTIAEFSFCQQGLTIVVSWIGKYPPKG